jgi:hypothetical protein
MSAPTQHPPSPPPVPRAFHQPHPLESTHHLYNHQPRDHGERVIEQGRWNSSGNDLHHQYRQHQSTTHSRTEQTHHHIVASHMPPQPQQHAHQYHQSRHDSLTDSCCPRGGPERWVCLGHHYYRDNPDSEWVESWKPQVDLVTDIYGIPEGDPLYMPHLRYTSQEFDDGDAPQEQAERQPMASRAPLRAMGGSEMAPSRSMNRDSGTGIQTLDNSSSSHARPPSLTCPGCLVLLTMDILDPVSYFSKIDYTISDTLLSPAMCVDSPGTAAQQAQTLHHNTRFQPQAMLQTRHWRPVKIYGNSCSGAKAM